MQQAHHPQEPIYHTLDPGAAAAAGLVTADGQQFDTLGRLDVMLPNGQFVPATLVRQKGGAGGVVPLVEMPPPSASSNPSPYSRKHQGIARLHNFLFGSVILIIATVYSVQGKSSG